VRVKRTELIEQLKELVQERTNAAQAEYEAALAKQAEAARKYEESTRMWWAEAMTTIKTRVMAKQPVLDTDIPEELRRMHGWGFRAAEVRRKVPQVGELTRLIRLLEASPDETVSVPSLERAGFSLGRVIK
jgi:hypothetical protein